MTAVPHLSHAVDAHGTLVAGRQSVVDTITGHCSGTSRTPELISFSPDGRLLVGLPATGARSSSRRAPAVAPPCRGGWTD